MAQTKCWLGYMRLHQNLTKNSETCQNIEGSFDKIEFICFLLFKFVPTF